MSNPTAADYLRDLGPLLVGLARDAREAAERSGSDFERGRLMGLYQAVSLLAQQADAFGMQRDEVGLNGVDVDNDLL